MKNFLKISNLYILLWCIYYLQGTLYASGSIISQGILAILLALSVYYAFYVNFSLKTPSVIKALNLFVLMLTFYGLIYWLSGEVFTTTNGADRGAINEIKTIYISLLPIYAFYAFTAKGLITDKTIQKWFFVFVAMATVSYFRAEQEALQEAAMRGSMAEEFTNNTGYTFLALMPLLFFFNKKKLIQYAGLAYILAFIIMGMKRGAILIGVIILFWFLYRTLKDATPKMQKRVFLLSVAILIAGGFFVAHMLETSEYFQYRLEQTKEGATSSRDVIFSKLFSYFINETTPWQFFFGCGTNYTIVVAGNYAHNDWLELAINQGCLGIIIYLIFWICFYTVWRESNSNPIIYSSMGALLTIYFLSTLFSMSYGSMSIYATLCLGYCLAQTGYSSKMINTSKMINI